MIYNGSNDPPTINIGNKTYVFWPPFDDSAEVIVLLDHFLAFAKANAEAFERFQKSKDWH